MGHVAPFGPGRRLLSPRTTFLYDSMVISSSPTVAGVSGGGCDGGAAAMAAFLIRDALVSIMHTNMEMQIEHMMDGTTIDSAMILKISRLLESPVD